MLELDFITVVKVRDRKNREGENKPFFLELIITKQVNIYGCKVAICLQNKYYEIKFKKRHNNILYIHLYNKKMNQEILLDVRDNSKDRQANIQENNNYHSDTYAQA